MIMNEFFFNLIYNVQISDLFQILIIILFIKNSYCMWDVSFNIKIIKKEKNLN